MDSVNIVYENESLPNNESRNTFFHRFFDELLEEIENGRIPKSGTIANQTPYNATSQTIISFRKETEKEVKQKFDFAKQWQEVFTQSTVHLYLITFCEILKSGHINHKTTEFVIKENYAGTGKCMIAPMEEYITESNFAKKHNLQIKKSKECEFYVETEPATQQSSTKRKTALAYHYYNEDAIYLQAERNLRENSILHRLGISVLSNFLSLEISVYFNGIMVNRLRTMELLEDGKLNFALYNLKHLCLSKLHSLYMALLTPKKQWSDNQRKLANEFTNLLGINAEEPLYRDKNTLVEVSILGHDYATQQIKKENSYIKKCNIISSTIPKNNIKNSIEQSEFFPCAYEEAPYTIITYNNFTFVFSEWGDYGKSVPILAIQNIGNLKLLLYSRPLRHAESFPSINDRTLSINKNQVQIDKKTFMSALQYAQKKYKTLTKLQQK